MYKHFHSHLAVLFIAACISALGYDSSSRHPAIPIKAGVIANGMAMDGTPTPAPTQSTSTPLLTRRPEESATDAIRRLIRTNGGCRLPCWWGIIPEKTDWLQLAPSLTNLSMISSTSSYKSSIVHVIGGPVLEKISRVSLILIEAESKIATIQVHADKYTSLSDFRSLWKEFSPENVVKSYGAPSRVWLQALANFSADSGTPYQKAPYILWLFFDEQGFLIRYRGSVSNEDTYKFCPSLRAGGNLDGGIEFYLRAADSHVELDSLVSDKDLLDSLKPISEVTKFTVNDFYQMLLSNKSGNTCFSIAKNVWP